MVSTESFQPSERFLIRGTFGAGFSSQINAIDATPWFQHAKPQDILDFAVQNWGYNAWSLNILEMVAAIDEDVKSRLAYYELRKHETGLEGWDPICSVNREDAINWLLENRPEVARLLILHAFPY